MQLLSIFSFCVFFGCIWTAKVPICKGINQTGTFYTGKFYNESLFQYSYNINVTLNRDNFTYPNYVTVYNFTEQLLNNSIIFNRTTHLFFWSGDSAGPKNYCTFLNNTCIISASNARLTLFFMFIYNNKTEGNQETSIFLNDGTIFDSQNGHFFDPMKCQQYRMCMSKINI